MAAFVARRLGQAVIVLVGVTLLTFMLEHLIPGSLARAIIGPRATSLQIASFDREYGLDRAVPLQYLAFVGQLLHGNLGYSYRLNQSVGSLVASELPRDVVLVGSALVVSVLIAVPIGVRQAVRRNRAFDRAGTGLFLVLYSMPTYWLGLLLVAGLAIGVHVLPAEAPQATTLAGILQDPRALVLPVLTLVLVDLALFSRYLRSSVIDTLAEDYVRTARAKGLSERLVLGSHVLRNSLVPVATLIGLSLPSILTDGLVVELVFNFPGVGLSYYTAAVSSDYPVELGITVLVGFATVIGSLVADIAYAILDPRVRYG